MLMFSQTQGLVERFNKSLGSWLKNEIIKVALNPGNAHPLQILNGMHYRKIGIVRPDKRNIDIGDRVIIPVNKPKNKIGLLPYTRQSLLVVGRIGGNNWRAPRLILQDNNGRLIDEAAVKCVKVHF